MSRLHAECVPVHNPPLGASPYGYVPSEGVCITAIVLFAVSTALHTAQAVYYSVRRRKLTRGEGSGESGGDAQRAARQPSYWWILATLVPGGLLEVIGWAGRYWSSRNVLNIQASLPLSPARAALTCWFSLFSCKSPRRCEPNTVDLY